MSMDIQTERKLRACALAVNNMMTSYGNVINRDWELNLDLLYPRSPSYNNIYLWKINDIIGRYEKTSVAQQRSLGEIEGHHLLIP